LFSEKRTDTADIVLWKCFLLEFAFEGIGKRLIVQLIKNPSQLPGERSWITSMQVCLDTIEIRVRRSCDHVTDVR
jgi:hypothetical protein